MRRAFFAVFQVTCEGSQGNNGKEVICFFALGDEMGFSFYYFVEEFPMVTSHVSHYFCE